MTMNSRDVLEVGAALAAGAQVCDEDLIALATSTDILGLAMLADDLRRRLHGTATTFVRVADVPLQAADAVPAIPAAAREVRVQGAEGFRGDLFDALRAVVKAAGHVPVTACSLADLETLARESARSLVEIGSAIRECGVAAVAEAPLDLLAHPEASFEAMRRCGLEVARVTVARNTDVAGRVGLLRRLKAVQEAAGGVRSFAPLARAWNPAAPSTGYEDARHVAVARLFAADVPTIQVDWSLYGPKLAQVALTMGANDLDAVPASDDAPDGRRRAPLEDVLRNIRAAALAPVERDARYQPVGG
jgi:aminodeoxyfutalosine synthase